MKYFWCSDKIVIEKNLLSLILHRENRQVAFKAPQNCYNIFNRLRVHDIFLMHHNRVPSSIYEGDRKSPCYRHGWNVTILVIFAAVLRIFRIDAASRGVPRESSFWAESRTNDGGNIAFYTDAGVGALQSRKAPGGM